MRRPRVVLVVLVLVAAAAAGYVAYRQFGSSPAGDRPQERPPPTVTVAPAITGTVRETVAAIGTLEAVETVALTAEVTSRVEAVAFDEGETVEQGEVLLRLETDEIRAELARAKAVRDEAENQYERAQALDTGRFITAAEVDRRERAYRTAAAEVERLQARMDDYAIVAPFSGRIGLRRVSPGSLVEPDTLIATISTVDPIELRFRVPAEVLPRVGPGTAVVARLESGGAEASEGEVAIVDADVDPATRTIALIARLPNAAGRLRPGMFMAVEVVLETRDAVLVPEGAVLLRGDESFVFRVADGTVQRLTVETGARRRGEVEIREGLAAGERVVVGGVEQVRDGQAVRIAEDGGDDGEGSGGG